MADELTFFYSKDGKQNARIATVALHSRYSIDQECRRFLTAQKIRDTDTVIVIGDCLTHITASCKTQLPGVTCYPVIPDSRFKNVLSSDEDLFIINPKSGNHHDIAKQVQTYFLQKIHESMVTTIKVLEWLPSKKLFSETHSAIHLGIDRFIQQLKANIATTAYFGKRWIQNTLSNILARPERFIPCSKLPYVCVSAPGPSLRETLRSIPPFAPILSCAAASAMLETTANILATVHTDAGYWARRHLDRYQGTIAMPLQASPLRYHTQTPLYQKTFIESFFTELEPPGIFVPEHGSVLGSAIYYAAQLTNGPIYLLGVDLAMTKNRFHEKGYILDAVNIRKTYRQSSFEAFDFIHYARHSYDYRGKQVTRPLQLFAESFLLFPSAITERLVFVDTAPPGLDIDVITAKQLKNDINTTKRHSLRYSSYQYSAQSAHGYVKTGLAKMKSAILEGDSVVLKQLQLHLAPQTLQIKDEASVKNTLADSILWLEQIYL